MEGAPKSGRHECYCAVLCPTLLQHGIQDFLAGVFAGTFGVAGALAAGVLGIAGAFFCTALA